MKILYAGDSAAGGPANYLLGILNSLDACTTHLPPDQPLSTRTLSKRYDAFILSDYSRNRVSSAAEKALCKQVEKGSGFLMVGGWGSFSGPYGGWHGSMIEKMLPVACLRRDDRLNFPGGAQIAVKESHPMFRSVSFDDPPVILGLNDIKPKTGSRILLSARKIVTIGNRLMLDPVEHPLLVIDANPHKRIAVFTTDFAPHWCGGLLDWGKTRVKLAVKDKIQIEVGDLYVRFVLSLLRWLTRD